MVKPKKLKKGDTIAVVSLSRGVLGEDLCKHKVKMGTESLKKMGLNVIFMPNSLKGIKYTEEHPEKRAQDLKEAFKNPDINGILCAGGGIDGFKIFPYLMEDEEFKKIVLENPKIFTGFSDTSVHHMMFYRLGLQTFYGPSFLTDIAETDNKILPYTEKYWNIYTGSTLNEITSSDIWYEERTDFSEKSIGIPRISHKETKGFELLQGNENFSGKLLGGCIESLYNIISGHRFSEQKEICEKYNIFHHLKNGRIKYCLLKLPKENLLLKNTKRCLIHLKKKSILIP